MRPPIACIVTDEEQRIDLLEMLEAARLVAPRLSWSEARTERAGDLEMTTTVDGRLLLNRSDGRGGRLIITKDHEPTGLITPLDSITSWCDSLRIAVTKGSVHAQALDASLKSAARLFAAACAAVGGHVFTTQVFSCVEPSEERFQAHAMMRTINAPPTLAKLLAEIAPAFRIITNTWNDHADVLASFAHKRSDDISPTEILHLIAGVPRQALDELRHEIAVSPA